MVLLGVFLLEPLLVEDQEQQRLRLFWDGSLNQSGKHNELEKELTQKMRRTLESVVK